MSDFQSDTDIIANTLGFNPQEFLNEISGMVDRHLVAGVESYKRELLSIAKNKNYNNITETIIEESIQKLHDKIKFIYDKNMDKFELYAQRNIFTLPKDSVGEGATDESKSASGGEEIDNQLAEAHNRLLEMQNKYFTLKTDYEDGELLLKDMREAIFQLKVGQQVLDEYSVEPLSKFSGSMLQQKESLEALTEKATHLLIDIERFTGDSSSEFGATSNVVVKGTAVGTAEDMRKMTQSISKR
jgi:hypothetical protein